MFAIDELHVCGIKFNYEDVGINAIEVPFTWVFGSYIDTYKR